MWVSCPPGRAAEPYSHLLVQAQEFGIIGAIVFYFGHILVSRQQ